MATKKQIEDTWNEAKIMSATQAIENLRSNKTSVHGKTSDDFLIDEPLYVYFIINSVATIGLYIHSFSRKFLDKEKGLEEDIEYQDFDLEEISF